MKALILETYNQPLIMKEVADPICTDDGVIIDIKACGVCRSDHHAFMGMDPDVVLPHVMGHEFAGIITEAGPDVARFKIGDRVTAPFILGCGQCADCGHHQPTICGDQIVIGFSVWGAFAERLAVPAADYNLALLPGNLSFEAAAGMGCRVTTAWRALTGRAKLQNGEWLAVHGCGGVGLSAVMIAKSLGAKVVAVDISANALEMAGALGADKILNAADCADVGGAVRALSGGGAHVSIDALGIRSVFDNSLRSLRKLGRHVQIGMPVGDHAVVDLPLLELIYSRQLSVMGTRGLGAQGFAPLMDMAAKGQIDLSKFTRHIALSETEGVLRAMDHNQPAGVTVINRFGG